MNDFVKDYVQRKWVPFVYSNMYSPGPGWQNSVVNDDLYKKAENLDTPLAILLGKPSNLVAIDVDVQSGGDAVSLRDRYGDDIEKTRIVSTPSGGWHFLFEYPEGVEKLPRVINAGKWIPGLQGVDMLADASHIKAPPTYRRGDPKKPDGAYSVVQDVDPLPMPQKLLDDWLAYADRESTYEPGTPAEIPPTGYEWAVSAHERNVKVAAAAPEGERDHCVYRKICSSVRIAAAVPDEVLSNERIWSDFRDGVPYEIKDHSGKMQRAIEYAAQHPWAELSAAELETDVPDNIRPEDVWEYLRQLAQQRIKETVQDVIRKEKIEKEASRVTLTESIRGRDFVEHDLETPQWVIKDLLQYEGKALLAAQYKAGKSTAMLEVIHALTTGDDFLGSFTVPNKRRVCFLDFELGKGMAQKWIRSIQADYELLEYKPMLGKGKEMDMRSDMLRSKTARQLRDRGVDVLIVDPLSPVMSALGIDENSSDTVRPMLDSLDELAVEAGLCATVVTHHTGHQSVDRARGSTSFSDWPTAIWSIQRGENDNRTFSAFGRDVQAPKTNLAFDFDNRRLTLATQVSPLWEE